MSQDGSSSLYTHGYTTGTFDLVHQGHINILREIKKRCVHVTVGLTSDRLGTKQKRPPAFSFEHRKAILLGLKYVDDVIEHDGATKQSDYSKLNFDALFIGSDYVGSREYVSFAQDFPTVPIVFIDRFPEVSTSMLLDKLYPKVISVGVQGPIFSTRDVIVKFIPIRSLEYGNTADVYNLPLPRPRNWKKIGAVHDNNNIPGVNSSREVNIMEQLKSYSWYTGNQGKYVWVHEQKRSSNRNHEDRSWELIRTHDPVVAVFQIEQTDGGDTLCKVWNEMPDETKRTIWRKIEDILASLKLLNIVHGDLHSRNICVNKHREVSVIDFGWCTSNEFEMTELERSSHDIHLRDNFDRKHLLESMLYDGLDTRALSLE